jgi:hypothetical protein
MQSVRFQFLTTVDIKILVVWNVTSCICVKWHKYQ